MFKDKNNSSLAVRIKSAHFESNLNNEKYLQNYVMNMNVCYYAAKCIRFISKRSNYEACFFIEHLSHYP